MMMLDDGHAIGINKWPCLPKAELLSFGWDFGFQLDSLEKYLITLAVVTFTFWIFFKIAIKKPIFFVFKTLFTTLYRELKVTTVRVIKYFSSESSWKPKTRLSADTVTN